MKTKILSKAFLALLAFLVGGCTSPGEYTKTGVSNRPERPENCRFEIYTIPPKEYYEELGVIEFRGGKYTALPRTIAEVKELSQKYICQAGGNGLLLWETNGRGHYINATVIHVGKAN